MWQLILAVFTVFLAAFAYERGELEEIGPFIGHEEAVIHALGHWNPISVKKDKEAIGLIFQRADGTYYYVGKLSTSKKKALIRWIPKTGERLVAIFHTHAASELERHQVFSYQDIVSAKRLGVVSYLGTSDGKIRVWIPGDPVQRDQFGRLSAKGRVIWQL